MDILFSLLQVHFTMRLPFFIVLNYNIQVEINLPKTVENLRPVATMAIMLSFPPKSLVGLLNSYFGNITVLCVLPKTKEVITWQKDEPTAKAV